jgi:hypothetical protein
MKQFPFLSRTSVFALGAGLLVTTIILAGIFVVPRVIEKDQVTQETVAVEDTTTNNNAQPEESEEIEVSNTNVTAVEALPTTTAVEKDEAAGADNTTDNAAGEVIQKESPPTPPVKNTNTTTATETKKTPTPTESKKETYTAVLTVRSPNGTTNYSVDVDVGATVQDLMNAATSQGFSFKTKQFASLGTYVTTMNGVTEDKDAGLYWFYKVNEKKATSGITSKRLKKGDTVQWSYEKEF